MKMYNLVGYLSKMDNNRIQIIIEEIKSRITPEGIKQYRDGFISSEATYYVLFCGFMRNTLNQLKDFDLLESILARIYRNLEFLEFSEFTNLDLVSEIFYSCESLKLLNCIETKQMIIHLAKYLFPQEVIDKILMSDEIGRANAKFRHLKVDKLTGGTIY